jgi:hypothetical protein
VLVRVRVWLLVLPLAQAAVAPPLREPWAQLAPLAPPQQMQQPSWVLVPAHVREVSQQEVNKSG